METGLHDKHGQMINEKDIVNWKNEKHNRIVRYHPQYLAFSLDDERSTNSYLWLTGGSLEWFEQDGKLCSPHIEIRSTFVA